MVYVLLCSPFVSQLAEEDGPFSGSHHASFLSSLPAFHGLIPRNFDRHFSRPSWARLMQLGISTLISIYLPVCYLSTFFSTIGCESRTLDARSAVPADTTKLRRSGQAREPAGRPASRTAPRECDLFFLDIPCATAFRVGPSSSYLSLPSTSSSRPGWESFS